MSKEKIVKVKAVKEKKFLPEVKMMNSGTRVLGTVLLRSPDVVVSEARLAAKALKDVIDHKQRKVEINGKRYLEFDDWQLLGAFYGVTAKVVSTEEIKDDKGKNIGFLAKAEAVKDGVAIAAAEAECLSYENNWKYKAFNQRFMLRSMAQTRACAKSLRNCLAWVVVLAGYASTPAEEMIVDEKPSKDYKETSAYKTLMRIAERKKIVEKVEKMLENEEEIDESTINDIIQKIGG